MKRLRILDPVGGQAIWSGAMVHTESKEKVGNNKITQHVRTLGIKFFSYITKNYAAFLL
jgi:hypothetical protein